MPILYAYLVCMHKHKQKKPGGTFGVHVNLMSFRLFFTAASLNLLLKNIKGLDSAPVPSSGDIVS